MFYFQPDNNPPRLLEIMQPVCNMLFNTNFGINFILYCATGQNFRRAMIRMFSCKSRRNNDTTGQISNRANNGKYIIFILKYFPKVF